MRGLLLLPAGVGLAHPDALLEVPAGAVAPEAGLYLGGGLGGVVLPAPHQEAADARLDARRGPLQQLVVQPLEARLREPGLHHVVVVDAHTPALPTKNEDTVSLHSHRDSNATNFYIELLVLNVLVWRAKFLFYAQKKTHNNN
ncbi:hypothetical protein FOCC_FOCC003202 [Frankliniella occidentalis]|nr:hypothetical protein FOCC_FOCC003202 [Frankliniella occidentalis]